MSGGDIFLGLLAILFPPIAVWIKCGICSCDSLINILLSALGYLPGLVHAWYIIAKFPDEDGAVYQRIPEGNNAGGTVTYYYVSREGQQPQGGPDGGHAQRVAQRAGPSYGTLSAAEAGQAPAQAPGQAQGGGEGSAGGAIPPTYAEAVKGDHKVQSH